MKSPGIIYRRYRQLKKKIFYEKLSQSKMKEHENCYYGKRIVIKDANGSVISLKLCLYGMNADKKPDICTNSKECNAYASKWVGEKVKEKFEDELKDWNKKQELYPELAIFEWVLDKDLADALKKPSRINKVLVSLIFILENFIKVLNKNNK